MNIVRPILHHATTQPDAPALVEDDRVLSYRELALAVSRTASHLRALGVAPGDRVGLHLHDTAEHIVIMLAVAGIGAVFVPLDWRARPAENARFIEALGLEWVLIEPNGRAPENCRAVAVDAAWHRAVASAALDALPQGDWRDPFFIAPSSGSTGAPKFSQMTHLQFHFAAAGSQELLGLAGPQRFLCSLPLCFVAGRNCSLLHLMRGDCVILYPSLFTPAEFVDVAARQRATVGYLVGPTVRQLLAFAGDEPALPGMAVLFSGGAPLQPDEKRLALRKLSPNFHERYGTTETFGISVLRPRDIPAKAESVGQPHSLAEIEVVDENDRPLAAGEIGRLRYRGPGLATPILAAPGQTNFRDGWFYPGEIALLDEQGFIYLQGRSSDLIIRRGGKFYPAEVESVLLSHADISDAAIVVGPGGDDDAAVVAFVATRRPVAAGELIALCRAHLGAHKVPREFRFLAELPKNTAGKIDKLALAKLFETDVSKSG